MKTSVQVVNEIEVKIDVELPSDKVAKELDRQVGEFGKRVRVNGFRPGKAPRELVKKSHGTEIANEAMRRLISESYKDAVLAAGEHRIVGEPQVEPGVIRAGEPLKYSIRAQVKPRVSVHSWQNVEVAVAPPTVSADEVNARIAALQEKHKERVPVDDRAADAGDIAIVTFQGWLDGVRDTRLDGKDLDVKLGSGSMIPGWEDELRGMTPGTSKKFDIGFPADYRATDLAGKTATFDVTLNQLFREEVPELDDAFAVDENFESFDALREDVHAKLLAEAEKRRKDEAEKKVIGVIIERNQFPVPPAMIESYAAERARSLLQFWRMQGLPENRAMQLVERNWGALQSQANFEVRRHLVLEALAAQEKIDADEDELSAAIVERIKDGGENVGKLYERPEMREGLRQDMIHKKALARVLESASIVAAAPEAPPAAGT